MTTAAAKRQGEKDWKCNECGKRMTAKAAERAMYGGTDGCPKCSGTDIDLAADAVPPVPATDPRVEQYIRQENSRRGIW